MTMNSTRPWALRIGTRNSAPTSTDRGGRSPSGCASQRGYWRATYPAKSFRRLVCSEWSASERSGSRPRTRSEEHTSELQSQFHLVCRLLLEKKKQNSEERRLR